MPRIVSSLKTQVLFLLIIISLIGLLKGIDLSGFLRSPIIFPDILYILILNIPYSITTNPPNLITRKQTELINHSGIILQSVRRVSLG